MRPEKSYRKKIKRNYETQLPFNLILKDEIKKKNWLKKGHKKPPDSTYETCDLDHETEITS